MGIATARILPYLLPLRRPWVAASATLGERRGALLRISDSDGLVGWGDCAPLPSSGAAGHARVFAALAECARLLGGAGPDTPSLPDAFPPEVRWALETALLDMEARRRGVPLARLLGAERGENQGAAATKATIAVNAALGPLDAGCAVRAREALAQGFSVAKIKVGMDTVPRELARLRTLARATQNRLRLRLDANGAWSETQAWAFLCALAELPMDAVEEPLAAPTLAALGKLQAALPFAIAVDESLPRFGADALIAAGAVRRLVLKPARLGGHRATLSVARQAARGGIEVVLTSVLDSAVGLGAAAHLALAWCEESGTELAHGLATSAWLAADVAVAPTIVRGRMTLPGTVGLGVSPEAAGAEP